MIQLFRPEALGMPSSSRYLATVRREMGQPSRAMCSDSCWSDRGFALSSPSISRSSSFRAAVPLTPSPAPAERVKNQLRG